MRFLYRNKLAFSVFLFLSCVNSPSQVWAGVVAENVIVVVNAHSEDSRTLANHYCELRRIPTGNVIYLEDVPKALTINLDEFKSKILTPILQTLDKRRLAAQTKVIAYSAGFPTSVKINEHTERITDSGIKQYQKPVASLTGLTFFYRYILADEEGYLGWESNLYARGNFERTFRNPFAGEDGEAFDKAIAELQSDNAKESGETLKKLYEEHPTLSAVAIKAAEAFSAAEQIDAAEEMLEAAIHSGWNYERYIKETKSLSRLMSNQRIAAGVDSMKNAPLGMQEPLGFSSLKGWLPSGEAVPAKQSGITYLLSCMLGTVHPNASTINRAVDVLQRSATADRTFPKGQFMFSMTSDVRTKTRLPGIANAMVYLSSLGQDAKILHGKLPKGSETISGLMLGTASFDLVATRWKFVPGAIADNLTSYGGRYETASQTKLNELLHAGAAMSSGAVMEPFSLQFKFPNPIMYGYYADGVTAIEAFYLSITSPYQTLIVGDPLCQPFARPPRNNVEMSIASRVDANGKLANNVQIRRRILETDAPTTEPHHAEIFLNGRMARVTPAMEKYNLTFPEQYSGVMQVTFVLVGKDPTEPAIRYSQSFDVPGFWKGPRIEARINHPEKGKMTIAGESEGASSIEITVLGRPVGTIEGSRGATTIEMKDLGEGPLRVQGIAKFTNDEGQLTAMVAGEQFIIATAE
ncbi:hypothetical protein Q31b_28860 [Novipirellula aureliae]|uniref:Uncharacterized protein n=1 Tax=Novipirellula aureliae TaxID=2527966 RepID=A0A5C6E2R5_9BACT|nr:hypothetical protein [Novipirellula aureliae]TWU41439.1 hypothetical protein Q31b_28860 [Novipirellula aureliae]